MSAAVPGVAHPGRHLHSRAASPPPRVTIDAEWPLVFFSLAAALLVALASAAVSGAMSIGGADFLFAALGTAAISALHLGKLRRAWRAILNLRTSWLSREIACYLMFTALSAAAFFWPGAGPMLMWPVMLTGFAALYSIDRVYQAAGAGIWTRLHSARALLTGLFLFGLLVGSMPVAVTAGLIKLILYSCRQPWFGSKSRAFASVLRLGLGFVIPLAIWRAYPQWILPPVLIAEVIDRAEYYLDLNIPAGFPGFSID